MRVVLPALAIMAVAAACARSVSSTSDPVASISLQPGVAVALLRDTIGADLGTLTITERGDGLAATGTLRWMAAGTHAIHIHAVGRCEPPFETAGGHWNPLARQHGTKNPNGPHAGDMQNIIVGRDGSAEVNITTPLATLRGTNGLLDMDGAAIVVHASADDYTTDPSGKAGARVACGVVRVP